MLEMTALFDLSHTIAGEVFARYFYPWEPLQTLGNIICTLGKTLSPSHFRQQRKDIWIAYSAVISSTAVITGPCIVDENAEIRHAAFIRGNAIVGKDTVVGNSTEIKNAVLFDGVQVPHFNYIGDSVLGYQAHLGAGVILSNLRSDHAPVTVRGTDIAVTTGLTKCGAFLGDRAEIGCNSVLTPGTIIGRDSIVYPLTLVRGAVPPAHILKADGSLVSRRQVTP